MKITDLLCENSIDIQSKVKTAQEAIDELVDLMEANDNIIDKESYRKAVIEREKKGSTGVGEGIAIPHGKSKAVKEPGLSAIIVKDGVDFNSLDGEPAKLFFLIAAPDNKSDVHLSVLSRLSTMLMDDDFKNNLLNAKSKKEFVKIIDEAESEKLEENEVKTDGIEILAITACTTGIAHTYMAAEALEKAGEETGHKIKVETHGQSGVKNKFTKEDIENASAIIVAADTDVDLSRFDGLKIVKTKVAKGIHEPEKLIEQVLSDKAKVYHSSDKTDSIETEEKERISTQIYRHLMSGVSHMLPFVVGGGILIAISFLLDDYTINPANFGMNLPVAAFFKTVGGAAFNVMLYILAGYIAKSIADRPGLVVGFVGGILAVNGTTFASLSDSTVELVSSGFLGALIAGFAGGYIVLLLKKLCSYLPKSLEGIKTILLYPVFGIFIMGLFMLLINPYIGSLNTIINDYLSSMQTANKVVLGVLLGAMMGFDLGGPVNKAAYTFATGLLASGQYAIMAAVMAGGMVPPLSIALLATFFPKKIHKKDKQAAFVNYVMGLSFITEGSIPFASEDPLKTIPAFVGGAAVAGGLSMAFDCTLMAPHGGIFVIATVGNPLLYLAAIAAGAFAGMAIMALLKKNLPEYENSKRKKEK